MAELTKYRSSSEKATISTPLRLDRDHIGRCGKARSNVSSLSAPTAVRRSRVKVNVGGKRGGRSSSSSRPGQHGRQSERRRTHVTALTKIPHLRCLVEAAGGKDMWAVVAEFQDIDVLLMQFGEMTQLAAVAQVIQ